MEELLEILNGVKPGVDYEHETDLVGHGIIDSVTMVTMVLEISDAFDIDISPVDIVPENFKTVDTIYQLITRLQDE
jgi:acyl carrier protein